MNTTADLDRPLVYTTTEGFLYPVVAETLDPVTGAWTVYLRRWDGSHEAVPMNTPLCSGCEHVLIDGYCPDCEYQYPPEAMEGIA